MTEFLPPNLLLPSYSSRDEDCFGEKENIVIALFA